MIVEKQKTPVTGFRLVSGVELPTFEAGYETYGQLNPNKSNAVLVCHGFPGTSHAAGKYAETDLMPGYWDAIIGPGKAIDTDQYFVVSVDSICNIMCKSPMVHTISPATADAKLFMKLEICDFVELQRLVLQHLGIDKLICVAGASMGSCQVFEWAVRYPKFVSSVIAGLPIWSCAPYLARMVHRWTLPINGEQPNLVAAFQSLLMDVLSRDQFDATDSSTVVAQQNILANTWANLSHPDTLLALAEAVIRFRAGFGYSEPEALNRISAPILLYSSQQDLLVNPGMVKQLVQKFQKHSVSFDHVVLPTQGGHLDGVSNPVGDISDPISKFIPLIA